MCWQRRVKMSWSLCKWKPRLCIELQQNAERKQSIKDYLMMKLVQKSILKKQKKLITVWDIPICTQMVRTGFISRELFSRRMKMGLVRLLSFQHHAKLYWLLQGSNYEKKRKVAALEKKRLRLTQTQCLIFAETGGGSVITDHIRS